MPPKPQPHERRRRELLAQITEIGFVLPGTLNTVMNRCGKPRCACHADPPRLHGPYITWTRKVAGKTQTRRLTPEQADRPAIFGAATVVVLAFLLMFGLVGGWFLAGRMLAPLDRISDATRVAATGSLAHRIRLPGRSDEFRQLADAFDAMLAQLEAHAAEQQRLADEQQRFAANASHELRTPLAITQTLLDVARNDQRRGDDELVEPAGWLMGALAGCRRRGLTCRCGCRWWLRWGCWRRRPGGGGWPSARPVRRGVRCRAQPASKMEAQMAGQLALSTDEQTIAAAAVWETLPPAAQQRVTLALARLLARLVEGERDE